MTINYYGNEIMVNIIGGFALNDKRYAVCSYKDVTGYKIVIVETVTDENGVTTTKDIPKEEINTVLEHFNSIKEEIMRSGEDESTI